MRRVGQMGDAMIEKSAKRGKALSKREIEKMQKLGMNYCYILRCSDDTYYTGWTNDLLKRLKAHQEGKGARYTKGRTPVRLIHVEAFDTKQEAMRREYEIKHFTREEKEKLCYRL